MYDFFDVSQRSEVTPELPGTRYFDCIGGTKEKRYFIAPEHVSRGEFLENNEHLLDDCILPIFKQANICVRQDPSFPIPGFYIISPAGHYKALDRMEEDLNSLLFFVLYHIRKGMREELNIQFINIYYEEKPRRSCNVHIILLPILLDPYPRLYDLDLNAYLGTYEFSFRKNRETILEYNKKMKNYIENINLPKKVEEFKSQILVTQSL